MLIDKNINVFFYCLEGFYGGVLMRKTKIFIDAGHNDSSFNTGAIGNGMREQDITYEVAMLLSDILRVDFDIKLSRPTQRTNLGHDNNSAVNARWKMSNEWGADYFISIHANAGGGTGAETFYFNQTVQGFAQTVQETYATEMNLRSRRTELTDRFAVLRHTNCPAILLELAFLDAPANASDIDILRDKRAEMAQAIAKGIFEYFNIEPKIDGEMPCGLIDFINIKYRGSVINIPAKNINGRYITTLSELAKIFGDQEVPVRDILELAGLTVDWDADTRTILVN